MGHYYEKLSDGQVQPRHFVPMTSRPDELRPSRITDIRKMWKEGRDVTPSVTTVGNVLAKHALINWKIDQHLIQAWAIDPETRKHEDMNEYEFIKEVKRLTELQMDIAPSAGTDFHKAMENYINGELDVKHSLYVLCMNVKDVLIEKIGELTSEWITEKNFVSNGYGGQIDLTPPEWVIDYKTKQTADKFKPGKMVYPEHHMQLAAYRKGVSPTARCANIFVCLEDGQIDFHEHKEEELEKGWDLFHHALMIWQIQNKWHDRS